MGTTVLLCPGALKAGALQGVRQNVQFLFVEDMASLEVRAAVLASVCMSSAPHKKSTCSKENTSISKKIFPVSECLHVQNTW